MSLLEGPSGHRGGKGDSHKTDKTPSLRAGSTHRLAEVMWQVCPLWVVEDAVVLAFGTPRLRDHAHHAVLTGHLEQWGREGSDQTRTAMGVGLVSFLKQDTWGTIIHISGGENEGG